MLENMDLLKDAAGGGCGMFDVGVRVRAGVNCETATLIVICENSHISHSLF